MLATGSLGLLFVATTTFATSLGEVLPGIPGDPWTLGGYLALQLALGWVIAWLYAATRFRLRASARTAVRIGLAVGVAMYVPPAWILWTVGELTRRPLILLLGWGVGQTVLAAAAAGLVHQLLKPEDARY